MKIIATTSQSVLLVDCITGHAGVLHRGAGLYYGIARIGTNFAVAARRRLVSSSVPRPDEHGCVLVFDRKFHLLQTLEAPFALRDMHQIAWFDDRLWVTCSFDDLIAIYDGSRWERWFPLDSSLGETNDRYHYNSFLVGNDEVVLLAHNHGPSDLHFFDRHSRAWRRSVPLGQQAHNIWTDDGAYVTCSSLEGKLIATSGWETTTGGFPRGACFGAKHRAVGISALSERGQRDWASGAIALYDPSWRPLHYVHLQREGMVLDLEGVSIEEAITMESTIAESLRFPILSQLSNADLIGA
jgi:hypothetical protein